MKFGQLFGVFLGLTMAALAQSADFTVRVEPKSAFVWGSQSQGAVSSILNDPLSGHAIYRLAYSGVEVSAKWAYERMGGGLAGDLLAYTATIANATDHGIAVRYGGISVDDRRTLPLWVVSPSEKLKERNRKDVWELSRLRCFTTGFLPNENFFSHDSLSKIFTVRPGEVMIVSAVTKDPRTYALRCSIQGCFPIGNTRFFINVDGRDYIFVWDGRSAVYCGS